MDDEVQYTGHVMYMYNYVFTHFGKRKMKPRVTRLFTRIK